MKDAVKKNISEHILHIILFVLFFLLFIYLFSDWIRYLLSCLNIDPNFLLAFITVITLIISIIQNKNERKFSAMENNKERKYNFNLNLHNFTRERVEIVIGKLFSLMNNSHLYLDTIKNIKKSLDEEKRFVDVNNILALTHDKENTESVGAYIAMYFSPYIKNEWDSLYEKINKIGSNCSNILINYNENYSLLSLENFENITLSQIDIIIKESEKLNEEIEQLTEEMKNKLSTIIVDNDKKIREKYINN